MSACQNCGEKYTNSNEHLHWCKLCQTDNLKENFTNWTSGNEKIDGFIQEMQLKINKYNGIIFEWIPYNQFSGIKEIGGVGFATVYSAIWKYGRLYYDKNNEEYTRILNEKVALKSQNITDEFLNEV